MATADPHIIIVDAGSTKTQWLDGLSLKSSYTPGINPVHLDDTELMSMIESSKNDLATCNVNTIAWYGAGCGSNAQCQRMTEALKSVFGTHIRVIVGSDLLCAARATADTQPAIVCILGTGSNSGVYDGHEIVDNIPPLGYILGDEGSGAAMGRRFVNALLKRGFSTSLTQRILTYTGLTKDEVQDKVYRQPSPNRYLASLAKIAAAYIDEPDIESLVREELDSFLTNNILRYSQCHDLPIHFVGGAAYLYGDLLKQQLQKHGLTPGIIAKAPLDIPGSPLRFV